MVRSFAHDDAFDAHDNSSILIIDDDHAVIQFLEIALRAFFSVAIHTAETPG